MVGEKGLRPLELRGGLRLLMCLFVPVEGKNDDDGGFVREWLGFCDKQSKRKGSVCVSY